MLPFPKRRSPSESDEELVLDEEDLVVLADVEEQAPEHLAETTRREPSVSMPAAPAVPSVPAPRARPSGGFTLPKPTPPPPAMRASRQAPSVAPPPVLRYTRPDERVEDDVAGECLATIAAANARPPARGGLRLPSPLEIEVEFDVDGDHEVVARRSPAVPRSVSAPPPPRPSVPWARESRPPPALAPFARSSSSSDGVPAQAHPSSNMRLPLPPRLPSELPRVDSVAPVSSSSSASRAPEPTVIVLREKPRRAWVVASAVLGAAAAVVAMRFAPIGLARVAAAPAPRAPEAAVAARPAEPAPVLPAAPVVASVPVASAAPAPIASAAPVAVVKFDEGVAITVAPPAEPAPAAAPPAAKPAPVAAAPAAAAPAARPTPASSPVAAKPAPAPPVAAAPAPAASVAPTPSLRVVKTTPPAVSPTGTGPRLPDGSYGLGGSDTPAPAPAAPAPSLAPAKRRPMTAEQELADAQLKASMR